MPIIFAEGFDWPDTITTLLKGQHGNINGTATTNWSLVAGRDGGQALRVAVAEANTQHFVFSLAPTTNGSGVDNTVILGFAFRTTEFPTTVDDVAAGVFMRFFAGTLGVGQGALALNTAGHVEWRHNTNTTPQMQSRYPLLLDTWHYIEMKIELDDSTPGSDFSMYIDGVLQDSRTSGDGIQSGTADCDNAAFTKVINFGGQFDYDDVYLATAGHLNGAAAGVGDDVLGDIKIETIYPDGDGAATSWTRNGGTTNFSRVLDNGDAADDDGNTTHNESSTSGHQDLYTMDNVGFDTTDGEILAVQSTIVCMKQDGGGPDVIGIVREGTTTARSDHRLFGTKAIRRLGAGIDAYNYQCDVFEQNPDTAADWTVTEVNAMQVGMENE